MQMELCGGFLSHIEAVVYYVVDCCLIWQILFTSRSTNRSSGITNGSSYIHIGALIYK